MDKDALSDIEQFLFHEEEVTHGLTALSLEEDRIVIRIGPWTVGDEDDGVIPAMGKETEAEFTRTEILIIDIKGDSPESLAMPWIIISFHSFEMEGDRFRFILQTDALELTFTGKWPSLIHSG